MKKSKLSQKEHPDSVFYSTDISEHTRALLNDIDTLNTHINKKKQCQPDLWKTIQEKLRIDWTYDSNAIEGSTLTRGETMFFLQEGLTSEGRPFKDFLDARNHSEAIDYLFDVINTERPINERLIKDINALLLTGVSHTSAINQFGQKINKPTTPGAYKTHPNHVQQFDGSIHYYTDPLHVNDEMTTLVSWMDAHFSIVHPIIVSAICHYNMTRIHPFDDGNGRGARLLMNLILIRAGYPPAVIRNEHRRRYIDCLSKADNGNMKPMIDFVCHSLNDTMNMILKDLEVR